MSSSSILLDFKTKQKQQKPSFSKPSTSRNARKQVYTTLFKQLKFPFLSHDIFLSCFHPFKYRTSTHKQKRFKKKNCSRWEGTRRKMLYPLSEEANCVELHRWKMLCNGTEQWEQHNAKYHSGFLCPEESCCIKC